MAMGYSAVQLERIAAAEAHLVELMRAWDPDGSKAAALWEEHGACGACGAVLELHCLTCRKVWCPACG